MSVSLRYAFGLTEPDESLLYTRSVLSTQFLTESKNFNKAKPTCMALTLCESNQQEQPKSVQSAV